MGIFKSSTVASLQTKSKSIVDVFTKTVTELKSVNSEVDKLSNEKSEQRNKLDQELVELSEVKASNERIVSKIEKILE